jgi:putative tricarboxylic transport membrane protein
MLGAIVTHRSALTLHDVTLIARLLGEYEVIVVPTASPFRTLADLVRAFKAQPESISWGGGSAGGTDQILAGLVADAVGVTPKRVNYIAFSGGGEGVTALLGGNVTAGVNGYSEVAPHIESGRLRALAISSAERLLDLTPSAARAGRGRRVENWRRWSRRPASRRHRRRLERRRRDGAVAGVA